MQAIFGAVPAAMTFLAGGFANREEALAAITSGDVSVIGFEWIAIMPAEMILVEDLPATAETRDYARALEILDLRPSELLALAESVAETSDFEVGTSDHKLIDAIRAQYEGVTQEDMPNVYP